MGELQEQNQQQEKFVQQISQKNNSLRSLLKEKDSEIERLKTQIQNHKKEQYGMEKENQQLKLNQVSSIKKGSTVEMQKEIE